MALDDEVRPTPCDALPTSKADRGRKWNSFRAELKQFIARSAVACLLVPAVLAAIGSIMDKALFGDYNPNFHVRYLAFSGWVASPFVLLRWSYSGGKYLTVLRLAIYLLQTTGIVVAYTRAVVSGAEPYHAVEHIRTFFSVGEQFGKITSQDDVYGWLENVMKRLYDAEIPNGPGEGRTVAGRTAMLLPLRLRQNRVRATKCTSTIASLSLRGFDKCYLRFSPDTEDRSPYTSMNFTWTNLPYKTFTGRVDLSDVYVPTTLNSYPLAGYWVFFPADTPYNLARDQIRAMKRVGWIDKGTRLIALDLALVVPELSEPIWGLIEFTIEISQTGQYLPNTPRLIFNHIEEYEGSDSLVDNGTLKRVADFVKAMPLDPASRKSTGIIDQGNAVTRCDAFMADLTYVPFYLGIFSSAVYTSFELFFVFRKSWRKSLRCLFTYTEALWVILLVISLALQCVSHYAFPCSVSAVTQDPFVSANMTAGIRATAVVNRFELHMTAVHWRAAREVLGLAMFVHIFNSMKFLVNFQSLGTLVRTVQAAGPELASFSLSFAIIFLAFMTMFYTIFSMQVKKFSTLLRSISSLWLGMLGELSMTDELWAAKEWAVPSIILFSFVSVFVLLTLIVAIVSNAHERIKLKMANDLRLLEEKRLARCVIAKFKSYKRNRQSGGTDVMSVSDAYNRLAMGSGVPRSNCAKKNIRPPTQVSSDEDVKQTKL